MVGRCKKRPANYDLLYLAIPGSNKSAHTEHLRIWPGIGEKVDSGEYRGPPFVAGPRPGPKVLGFLKYIQKALKFRREVTIEHLLGKRVEVYWAGSRVSKRWKSATVAAHEQHGKFWLEYNDHFDNKGNQFFLEKLLTKKSPQWRFEGDE